MINLHNYYSEQSIYSDPKQYSEYFEAIPKDINIICQVCQGLFLHETEGPLFNYKIPLTRYSELSLRTMKDIIDEILNLENKPLIVTRPVNKRLIGSCRNLALFVCSILRQKQIPARLRVGFATYAYPKSKLNLDHVLLEYWNYQEERWILIDPRISKHHIKNKAHLEQLNPYDINRHDFITADKAWIQCRNKISDPNHFGVGIFSHMRGLYYVRNKLIHDFVSLRKIEMLPYDLWGFMLHEEAGESPSDEKQLTVLDNIAQITDKYDQSLMEAHTLYEQEQELKIPSVILSDVPVIGVHSVNLTGF